MATALPTPHHSNPFGTYSQEAHMNTKTLSLVAGLVAAFASLSSSAALAADEYTLNQNLPARAVTTAPFVAAQVAAVDEYQRNLNGVASAPTGTLRAQVRAEAIEARKLGLLVTGEASAPVPTAAQLAQIHLAGVRAVSSQVATK